MGRRKQILLGLGVTFPVIVAIALIKFFQVRAAIAEHSNFTPPPEAITTAKVDYQEWNQSFSAVGTLTPVRGAMLGAEVIGRVAKIAVESGQTVEAGTLLIALDTEVEEAQLKEAEARLERAKKRVDRYEGIRNTKALSPETLDDAWMEYRQALAAVETLKSTIRRKNVVAPFAGTVGIRQVNVGQVLVPGMNVVPLTALDELFADFTLPQQSLPELRVGLPVVVSVDTFPGTTFRGTVSALDSRVADTTRSVAVRALVSNPEGKLRPGMFIKVSLELPEKTRALVVPASSVNFAPYGDSVYVVQKGQNPKGEPIDNVVQKIVTLGERRGDLIMVKSGLNAGDEVASSGVFKLRPGAAVFINNSLQPAQSIAPTPEDS